MTTPLPTLPPMPAANDKPCPHNLTKCNDELVHIHEFLGNPARICKLQPSEHEQFVKWVQHFFLHDECLWRQQTQGQHQLVLTPSQHNNVLCQVHDVLGHKGYYATLCTLLDCIWWPSIA